MKKKRTILILIIVLCAVFVLGFVRLIVVAPEVRHNFETCPRFAIAGQRVTVRTKSTTDNMVLQVYGDADDLEQISETDYRFTMPFHNVHLSVRLINEY